MLYRKPGPGERQLGSRRGDFAYEYKRVNAHQAALRRPAPARKPAYCCPAGRTVATTFRFGSAAETLTGLAGFRAVAGGAIELWLSPPVSTPDWVQRPTPSVYHREPAAIPARSSPSLTPFAASPLRHI